MKPYSSLPLPDRSLWAINDPGFDPNKAGELIMVKQAAGREVFKTDRFYIKAFKTGVIRHIVADPAWREHKIAMRLNVLNLTAPPAAFCHHDGWSYFAAERIHGPDLETFFRTDWKGLSSRKKRVLAEQFALFLEEIAASGVFQPDFHLNNVLFDSIKQQFILIDLHRAKMQKNALSDKGFMKQLSFILPPLMDNLNHMHIMRGCAVLASKRRFLKTRKGRFLTVEAASGNMKRYWRRQGWRKTCSKFEISREIKSKIFTKKRDDKKESSVVFSSLFLSNPDLFINAPDSLILKDSRHTFCVKTIYSGSKPLFIKGYRSSGNLKSMSYLFRTSRVEHAWNMSWQLEMRGIPTPLPLDACHTGNPWDRFYGAIAFPWISASEQRNRTVKMYLDSDKGYLLFLKKIASFLWQMHERGISHGDCKITNFVIQAHAAPFITVFDLDSAQIHRNVNMKKRLQDITAMAFSLHNIAPHRHNLLTELVKAYISLHNPWIEHEKKVIRQIKKMACKKEKKQQHR